jgi:hypothetical protein
MGLKQNKLTRNQHFKMKGENKMIKYAEIDGYENLGELQMFSHLYQFIEKDKETPMIILIHAYECDTKVFKGYVFNETQTYNSIPLNNNEIEEIEKYTGKLEQVQFIKFIMGTIVEDSCKGFKESEIK